MARYIEVVSDSLFNETYEIEEIKFEDYFRWSDSVGSAIRGKVKGVPSSINYAQNTLADKAGPIAKVDVNEIKYESQKFQIQELQIDE